jgi:hypothetical protein
MPQPLFIDSVSSTSPGSPGAYALEIPTPSQIDEVSTGYVGYCGQFNWGPVQEIVVPTSPKEFLDTFEPAGSPRTSTGYLGMKGRRGFTAKIIRILASDAVQASATMTGTGGDTIATAKYPGTLGNSITITQAAATSGTSTKRKYTVTLTDATSGTTTEVYDETPIPTGTDVEVDVSDSLLLESLILEGAMTVFPSNATVAFTSGSNGTALAASDYTGTAGANDKGVALFESDSDIRVLCHDDCGNSLRAAVNLAFSVQCTTDRDRRCFLDGNPDAADFAAVQAYVVSGLTTDRVTFCGAWVTILDDAGVTQTVPFSTFAASAYLNLEPQQSYAWWSDVASKYYDAITGVVANFAWASSTVKNLATRQSTTSICLPHKTAKGKFVALHGRNTDKSFAVTRKIKDFFALSIQPAMDPFVNGPNLASENLSIKAMADNFFADQERKGRIQSPIDGVRQWSTSVTANTAATMGQGDFFLDLTAVTPVDRERIIMRFNIGPTVTVVQS